MDKKYKFKFQYSILVIILLVFVIAVSVAGLGFSIYNLVKSDNSAVDIAMAIFKYVILVVNLAVLGFSLSILLCSRYQIHNDFVLCRFGPVYNKYKKDDIVSFTRFKKSNTLVMYFKDAEFTVIVIAPEKYDEFVKAVREINPSISYSGDEEEL